MYIFMRLQMYVMHEEARRSMKVQSRERSAPQHNGAKKHQFFKHKSKGPIPAEHQGQLTNK
jgi:hypothetical protein